MSERRRGQRAMVAAALLGLLGALAHADPDATHAASTSPAQAELAARATVVDQARALIAIRQGEQRASTAHRLRELYKLTRAGQASLWFDRGSRARLVEGRAVARVVKRDLGELALLDREAAEVKVAAARIAGARAVAVPAPPPPASLARPVAGKIAAGYGRYREVGVELSRRGIELATRADEPVAAPAAGQVRFAGTLRGLGVVVVLDHGDFSTVLTGLASAVVTSGDRLARGEAVGRSVGHRIGLEVRLHGAGVDLPVDPEPLLAR